MPNWNEVLKEIKSSKSIDNIDMIRRKYLKRLYKITGRNVIAYYSCFLQKTGIEHALINDEDKNGFMNAIYGLDRTKGLDLILHTPGGNLAATESLVDYLKQMFGNDIRAIIPQISMSAGTMIACACKEIVMGKESNIGPIDPQFRGISASGVIEEFNRAYEEIKSDPDKKPIWKMIMKKYHPSFVEECENQIKWSQQMVTDWLAENMLSDRARPVADAAKIVDHLGDHHATWSHERHIGRKECEDIGLKIVRTEEHLPGRGFQDAVLTAHHTFMHTFDTEQNVIKIIENHKGTAMVKSLS